MKVFKATFVTLLIILLASIQVLAEGAPKTSNQEPGTELNLQRTIEMYGIDESEIKPLLDAGFKISEIRGYLNTLYPFKGSVIDTEACRDLRQKTGLSMKEALTCLQMAVRFGKDPEVLAKLFRETGDWHALEEALLKYSRAKQSSSVMLSSKGKRWQIEEASRLIGLEFGYYPSAVAKFLENGASIDQAAAIAFFHHISGADGGKGNIDVPYELSKSWLSELPEEFERFLGSWPVRKFPEELLPLKVPTRNELSLSSVSSMPRASSVGTPVDITDYASLYDIERNLPFGDYFNGFNESINPSSGSMTISQTDFVLPGKYGNDFAFTRYYDSGEAQLEEYSIYYLLYYVINAGGYYSGGTSSTSYNQDGSYQTTTYYEAYAYGSQESDDGWAYGTTTEYTQVDYYHAPPDDDYPYNTTTTHSSPYSGYVIPNPEDSTPVLEPIIEISPYDLSKKAISLAAGWNLDFPVYEDGGNGPYVHMGSQGSYGVGTEGYLENRDSQDLRLVNSNEYSYGGKVSEHKLTNIDGTIWYFNADGYPMAKKDRFGQYIRILYNTADRLDKIIDTVGRTIRFDYPSGMITVTVHEDDQSATPSLMTWTYNLSSTSEYYWKKLSSVQPPTGLPTYYVYQEVDAQINYSNLTDYFKRLLITSITNPAQGISHYSYTSRLRALFGDQPSTPQPGSDNQTEYLMTYRYDEVPTKDLSNGNLITATRNENLITYDYGFWDDQTASYTTTATRSRVTGETGKAPAVEKWTFDLLNRQRKHILIGSECGDDRQRTETVTQTYSYADNSKRTPRSIIEEITYSGTSEKTVKETITFYNDKGKPGKVLEPDGTMKDFVYDKTYWLTAKELTYQIETAAGAKLGKETLFTLDSTKMKPVMKQDAMVRMVPNGVNEAEGPTGTIPNNGEFAWYPFWITGGDIISSVALNVYWSTGGWGGDTYFKVFYKRSSASEWIEHCSFFKDGGLFAQKGDYPCTIAFPEAGFWDVKVVEYAGVNKVTVMKAYVVTYLTSYLGDCISTSFTYSTSHPGNIIAMTSYAPHSSGVPGATESVTTYSYDSLWNAYPVLQETAVTMADGNSGYSRVIATYDKLGRPTMLRQEGSQGLPSETSYQYDALGRVILVTNPPHDGSLTSTKSAIYNDAQRNVEITDEVGNKVRSIYDGLGRQIASEYLDVGIWKLTSHIKFDSLGMETELSDALGIKTSKQYDAFGREIKVIRPDQTYAETWYASTNLAISTTPTLDLALPYGFSNEPIKGWKKTTDAGGVASFEGYDLMGRVIWSASNPKVTPPAGAPVWDMVRNEYDKLGRLTKTADKRSAIDWDITVYGYIDGDGKQNVFGKPASMDLPGTTKPIYTYAYDGRGNLVGENLGTPDAISSIYDELGRVKLVSYGIVSSQMVSRFFYDCRDKLISAELYEGGALLNSLMMEYNLRGWQTSETFYKGYESWELDYSYNAAGARTRVTYPDNTWVDYEYDSRGLLSRIPGLFEYLSGYGTAGFSYDANGRLTGMRSSNGVTTSRSYDTLGRLGSISIGRLVPGDILGLAYQYTSRDLVSSITEYDGTSKVLQFGYDPIGRLTSSDVFGYQDRAKVLYTYDGAGNRLTELWKDAQNVTIDSFAYTYDPGNYLTYKGSSSFNTGSYGQMTSRNEAGVTTTYAYNPMRMMKEASEAGVTLAKYEYDALGRRIISWLDDEWRTISLWSGNDSIFEIRQEWTTPPPNPPTETITRYVAVNGQYLAKLVGSPIAMQPLFHHTDIVGTVRAVTDINGIVVARYTYEPFGSLTTASGLFDGELHRFTGKPSDFETSLSYFNARYYDSTLGRFTSSDPAKDGRNWYEYCNGDPVINVDPDGKKTIIQYAMEIIEKIREGIANCAWFGSAAPTLPQMQGPNTIGQPKDVSVGVNQKFEQANKTSVIICSAYTIQFDGKIITQNNSLFDPYMKDIYGRTNIQRMEKGIAPIGYDGKSINIHHIDQTDNGPLMEILGSNHQQNYSNLHQNSGQMPSLISRPDFDVWRNNYWVWRASGFTQ